MYEGALCVCCMSTEDLELLFGCGNENKESENYAKILRACLNIQVSEEDGHDSICAACVTKLRACVDFKIQVLRSISILSSVTLNKLLPEEDRQVLGLHKQKDDEMQQDEDNMSIERLESPFNETLTENGEEAIVRDNSSQKIIPKSNKRGRPRIHPPDSIPYIVGKDELRCRECGREFPNNITLKVHYNTHFGQHKCGICDKSFIAYASLKKHETTHQDGHFQCLDCNQEFRNKNTYESHRRIKHKNPLPYRCKECGRGFRTVHRRLRHLATAHRLQLNYHCHYCNIKFRYSGERAKHIANCHEVKYFPCPICGVKYRRAVLRAHLQRHLGVRKKTAAPTERRFTCKLCSKAFTQKKSLIYHIGVHTRRGEYHGDTDYLIVDNKLQTNNYGLLSEEDYNTDYLDENLLSENTDDHLGVSDLNIDTIASQLDTPIIDAE